jgi:DNA-binding transcriptional MerR regulator
MQPDGVTSRAPSPAPDAARPEDGAEPDDPPARTVPPVDPAEPMLTVAAAARRLGIAPSTLRTWERRYGIGPSAHEAGRHRRYAADDIARLELMQHALLRGASPADAAAFARTARLPRPDADPPDRPRRLPDPPGPAPAPGPDEGGPVLVSGEDAAAGDRVRVGGRALRLPGAGRTARGVGRAALALDSAAVRRLLAESVAEQGVARTWDEVARPVLVALGERWADTGAGVEIEHLVSECVTGVFGAHAAAAPAPRTERPVLLAGMPDELHALPLVVLSAALADRGVECRSLGARLPADALVAAVRRTAPAAVVLWSQMHATADVDVLRGLPRTRPRFRTFVAGPGWTAATLPPRVVLLDSLAGAEDEVAAAVLG